MLLTADGGGLWTFLVRFNSNGSIASSTFLGRGVAGEPGGALRSGVNGAGVRVALDNGVFGGSPVPGRGPRDPATIGFEIDVPWSALGFASKPVQPVRCLLAQVQRDPGQFDHILPDAGVSAFPLPVGPNFATLPGAQYLVIP